MKIEYRAGCPVAVVVMMDGRGRAAALIVRRSPASVLLLTALFVMLASTARAQVANGDFSAGGTGWTNNAPANSSLSYAGNQLTAVSDNNGGTNSRTYASQAFTAGDPGYLSLLLRSYTSTDVGRWDYPTVFIDGTFFWITPAGALSATETGTTVDNANTGITNVNVVTTLTAGAHTIGAGVTSIDSIFGPGIAIWDDIDFQELTQSPGAQVTDEDTNLVMSGAAAPQVATNSGLATMSVTVSVTNGTLALSTTAGLTVTGNNSASVTLSGSPAAINTALDGLTYTPTPDFNGADTLTFDATGGTVSDTDTIAITVNPVPDPELTIAKSATFVTGTAPAGVGDVIRYTYLVTNTGDTTLDDVQVTDSHNGTGTFPVNPGNAVLTDNAPTGDSPDTNADPTIWGALAPGDIVTFSEDYTVTQSDVDTLQ